MNDLITNKILVIPLAAWLIAQILKVIVILIREKRLDIHFLVGSGGMPSSHSAIVAALATAVALQEGVNSVLFAMSVMLAAIVMYDAAGVRRSVGKQASVLNRIINELKLKKTLTMLEHDLIEFIGHTPFQVYIGAGVGILVAWLWFLFSN